MTLNKSSLEQTGPILYLGMGIPGSGKTTDLTELSRDQEITRVSPDDIREQLSGDAADQSVNVEAWVEANRQVDDHLTAGESVILDSTAADKQHRLAQIERARDLGARVVGLYFIIDTETAKQRNRNRNGRTVPDNVIDRMTQQLIDEPVDQSEGFEQIIYPNQLG